MMKDIKKTLLIGTSSLSLATCDHIDKIEEPKFTKSDNIKSKELNHSDIDPSASISSMPIYTVLGDPSAVYRIIINEDLENGRILFVSSRTSKKGGTSYSIRAISLYPDAAWYLGPKEGVDYIDDEVRPTRYQIDQAREVARIINFDKLDGNPYALVEGSSTWTAVEQARKKIK